MKGIDALYNDFAANIGRSIHPDFYRNIRLFLISSALCLALSINILPANAQNKMPRGSFLKYPVHTTAELLDQIKTEPLVAARFARLFNMSPDMIRLAFAKLRLVRLAEPMKRRIYYVHQYESLGYKMRKIRAGTMIFAYPDGTPVLMQVCGNPLRTPPFGYGKPGSGQPSIPEYSDMTDNAIGTASSDTRASKMRNEVPPSPEALPELDKPLDDFIVSEDVIPVDQPIPAFHRGAPGSGLSIAAINQILSWIAGIGATAGLFAGGVIGEGSNSTAVNGALNGGSDSTGGVTGTGGTTGTGGNTNTGSGGNTGGGGESGGGGSTVTSDIVPESGSLWLFLFGGGAIAIAAFVRKRFIPTTKV